MPQRPGDTLIGRVTKTSRSVDPTARTLLTEVDVANKTGVYLPGMYAQAQMQIDQAAVPIHLPATGLVIATNGAVSSTVIAWLAVVAALPAASDTFALML